jgi:alpha-beta hydrolase superfamily lysophospholipase
VHGAQCSVISALVLGAVLGAPAAVDAQARNTGSASNTVRQAASAAAAKHDVVVDGHHFAVWEKRGAQPRAAILLLHGRTWSSLPNFDLQVPGEKRSFMEALAGAGFDVFALDMRGYGATPRDTSGWLTPDRAVADVAGVLAWMQQRAPAAQRLPIYLFGLSRGAMIAAMTAQRKPETLAGVVLLGFGFDPDAQSPSTPPGARPERLANTADAAASDFITKDAFTSATLTAFVRAALKADPALVDWRDDNQFNAFRPAQMQVPALLVHGEHDPQAPMAIETKLFTRFGTPDKWWVILPGADHAAHLEKSSVELVRAIASFARRHEVPNP